MSSNHLHRSRLKRRFFVNVGVYIFTVDIIYLYISSRNAKLCARRQIRENRRDARIEVKIRKKKSETINKKDNREKKCSGISLFIIFGGGPHCGGCDGLRPYVRRRLETICCLGRECGISVQHRL